MIYLTLLFGFTHIHMKKLFKLQLLLLIYMAAFGCVHQTDKSGTQQGHLDGASWIGDGVELPVVDSLYYEDDPSPIFRREFDIEEKIESATLYITAAGYYVATLNGNRIGNLQLDPAWTDYSKRIYYSEYDVTSAILDGGNCMGVSLGNGFYNPLPMRMWGSRNLRNSLPVGRPVFIARLVIEQKDGPTLEIVTDQSWQYAYGPVIRNSIYLGEVYDAKREIPGWNQAGFDASDWKNAAISTSPGGVLQKAFFPPILATDTIDPVQISSRGDKRYIVDMGVNFTGDYRIKLRGNRGDTITFRFGERVYDHGELNPMTTVCGQIKGKGVGGPGAPDTAWQTDSYIVGDGGERWYNPEFTFHTYRYMEITGLENKLNISDIQGIALNSRVANRNHFTCSSHLINSIQDASERTFLSNLIGVQSDCAAREKFGYGGDLNATSESFICNFDMQSFYRKTIYDWVDALNDSLFVDTAPFVGIKYCGLSWESAFLTTQYYLYLYYNDTEIIRELYDLDIQWMEKAARIHPGGIVDQGLSDHESLEPVPVELTGTGHYLQCAQIMEEFARVMGDTERMNTYRELAEDLRSKIAALYWDQPVTGNINRQTLFATLLYHDIVPENEKVAAVDSLLSALEDGPSGHLSTGIFGTKYTLEALSRAGHSDAVFDVVNSTSYPGWGFMIDRGATTIWETWKESDNTYSNCHPMFGSVSQWLYQWLGGIRPDPAYPGFARFHLSPSIPPGLDSMKCNYISPQGEIISSWSKEGQDQVVFDFTVPENSVAMVKLSADTFRHLTITETRSGKTYTPDQATINSGEFDLHPGEYHITATGL